MSEWVGLLQRATVRIQPELRRQTVIAAGKILEIADGGPLNARHAPAGYPTTRNDHSWAAREKPKSVLW